MSKPAITIPPQPLQIAESDRKEFPYHTDSSIIGIKLIRLQSTSYLLTLNTSAKREPLRKLVGADTNPSWVQGRIAETLYDRGEIDGETLDRTNGR